MNENNSAILYQIYPLAWGHHKIPGEFEKVPGIQGPFKDPYPWIEHLKYLGCNVLQLGPLWKSKDHGYDTLDYYEPDPRIASKTELKEAFAAYKKQGIRLVLDAVFNHSGKEFFAFQDLMNKGKASAYTNWYKGLSFKNDSQELLDWSGWHGFKDLPEFNLKNPDTREYLIEAALHWIEDYDIDGLRLDAADCLGFEFICELSHRCKEKKPNFWIMAEVIHGDYNAYVKKGGASSVTNYELWKGLWSAHNDKNYFELAWTLKRQFQNKGDGFCDGWVPVSFTENHDVARLASLLKNPADLFPLWGLLFTCPGTPSVYYGSEGALEAEKQQHSDWNLRPILAPKQILEKGQKDLHKAIQRLIRLRQGHEALRLGTFRLLENTDTQISFLRESENERLLIAVSAKPELQNYKIDLSTLLDFLPNCYAEDVLNGGNAEIRDQILYTELYPSWLRVFRLP